MNKIINLGKIKTSKIELVDISKSWLALSFAFALAFSGTSLLNGTLAQVFSIGFLTMFLVSLFTAGLGFLFHELAHKFTAQRYGCIAEFRAFDTMLYLAVGLAAFVGFIFAAPGAVMISGMITRKENGVISVAGPATNYVLAMIFFGLSFAFPALASIFGIGMMINLWLGLFNLIPFGNFDGLKIFHWNNYLWLAMVAFGVYFLFFF